MSLCNRVGLASQVLNVYLEPAGTKVSRDCEPPIGGWGNQERPSVGDRRR